MQSILKKIIFVVFFNSSLFALLIIGLQNNSNKKSINLVIEKTVTLPIGFIVGTSFITGSIIGSFFKISLENKKKS